MKWLKTVPESPLRKVGSNIVISGHSEKPSYNPAEQWRESDATSQHGKNWKKLESEGAMRGPKV